MKLQTQAVSRPSLELIQYKRIEVPEGLNQRYHYLYTHPAGLVLVDVATLLNGVWRIAYTTVRARRKFIQWGDFGERPTDRQLALACHKFINAAIQKATTPLPL